eukprot:715243-Hanusia_phi.AAC.2
MKLTHRDGPGPLVLLASSSSPHYLLEVQLHPGHNPLPAPRVSVVSVQPDAAPPSPSERWVRVRR